MIAAAINAYGARQQTTFQQDRSQTVGASEVGKCAREVFYLKNEGDVVYGGIRDPEAVNRWGASHRGTIIERELWVPALRATHGDNLLFAGREQRTLVSGFLSATADGLLINQPPDALAHLGVSDIEGDCLTVECKSVDPRTNLAEPKPENVFQVIVQIGLIREMTPYRPTWGLLSYVDASFWDVVHEFPIQFNEAVFEEARRRARDIMLATSAARLKPEGAIAGGKDCNLCAFTAACGVARADRVPTGIQTLNPALASSLVDLARSSREARKSSAALLLEAKQSEEEIRALLVAANTRKLSQDGISISWTPLRDGDGDRLTIKVSAPAPAVELPPIGAAIPVASIKAA